MRRWNGWGDDLTNYPLPESAGKYLLEHIGSGDTSQDAALESVLSTVPPSRLPERSLVSYEPIERLMHARGQSLPDWIALRTGRIGDFPDGVAYPTCDEELRSLFGFGQECLARLIAFGGGTSVVGHINPTAGGQAVLTVDLSYLDRLISLDTVSQLATIEAGASGPKIERQLGRLGYTLGHFPQSFEFSTLGGWIATRSSGQQSYYYGRIEGLFAGGHLETLIGPLDLPPLPASAAGPDIRQIILGSEGRFGVITRAVVRVRPLPQSEIFFGAFFHSWDGAMAAVRKIAQERVPISMARLSDAQETETTLMLSGKTRLVEWADRGLRLFRYGPGRCLLIYGITGEEEIVRETKNQANDVITRNGGLYTGVMAGRAWRKSRFLGPYLRNSLWEAGYAIDTLETALPWCSVGQAAEGIKQAIRESQEHANHRVLVLCHLSHIYEDGASIYITYLFPRMPDPDETIQNWKAMKSAASQAIIQMGGTISHQHGVGIDHKLYLHAEKGLVGIEILQGIARVLDAGGLLNPGKLID